ncbi:MAG: glycosyltransferase family 2 protein, partial [Patescibacteria group bacterium]
LSPTDDTLNGYRYIFLIPVLREQEIIRQNFKVFANLEGTYELIYITTQKEDAQEREIYRSLQARIDYLATLNSETALSEALSGILPQTIARDLAGKFRDITNHEERKNLIFEYYHQKIHTREMLQALISSCSNENIRMIDYPYTDGSMAHQLNYACNEIVQEYDPQKTFVLVYNADSIVSNNLISHIVSFQKKYPYARVIQQSALFFSNFSEFGSGLRKYFLQAIALLQSRWTLAHELPRLLNQQVTKIGAYIEGAHVVGHGLCIRLDTLKRVGYFPTTVINEYLPLGYLLRLSGETIYPLPVLENAQSPSSIKSMFNQYRVWFYGAISYPLYLRNAFKQPEFSKVKAILWAGRYMVRAGIWLGLSFIWVFLLTFPFIVGNHWLLLSSLGVFIVYTPLNFLIIQYCINKRGTEVFGVDHFVLKIPFATYCMSILAYLTHSWGPVLAIKDIIVSVLFSKKITKVKTER